MDASNIKPESGFVPENQHEQDLFGVDVMQRRIAASESVVVAHFFTKSDDETIYCAKDTMPQSLWGFLVGGYSRSHLSLSNRFLQIFKDLCSNNKNTLDLEKYSDLISNMASEITNGSNVALNVALERAEKFMRIYAVKYGHNSLKDSCADRFAVDNVSIYAAKVLEETSLGAFQEKSTRYIDFSKTSPVFPYSQYYFCRGTVSNFKERLEEVYAESLRVYTKIQSFLEDYYYDTLEGEFISDKARMNTAKAKAFDSSRYCLMTCAPTALGFTMPTRETERHISKLLGHSSDEVRIIATKLHEHALAVNPGLLNHVKRNTYMNDCVYINPTLLSILEDSVDEDANARNNEREDAVHADTFVTFNEDPYMFFANLAASIILETTKKPTSLLSLSEKLFAEASLVDMLGIIVSRLESRGEYDDLPASFQQSLIRMTSTLDFGAYRDLQRHRVGTQSRSEILSSYDVPEGLCAVADLHEVPDLHHTGESLIEEYEQLMLNVESLRDHVRYVCPGLSDYIACLGNHVVFNYSMDFRQFIYMCELRSRPHGHVSYRRVVIEAFNQFRTYIDTIRVEYNDNSTEANKVNHLLDRFLSSFRVASSLHDGNRSEQENRAELKQAQAQTQSQANPA